jgi:hypothetical protein
LAGLASGLNASKQTSLGREELPGAAPGPLDKELDGFAFANEPVNPAREFLVFAPLTPLEIENVQRPEEPPEHGNVTKLYGGSDMGNGDAEVGSCEEQVRAEHEIEVAAMGRQDYKRAAIERGTSGRFEGRDVHRHALTTTPQHLSD